MTCRGGECTDSPALAHSGVLQTFIAVPSTIPHRQAVAGMLLVTLMWSMAGVITRHLESAQSFEVTFWRSFFTGLALAAYYAVVHGRDTPRLLAAGGRPLWISGLMWSVMFTC